MHSKRKFFGVKQRAALKNLAEKGMKKKNTRDCK